MMLQQVLGNVSDSDYAAMTLDPIYLTSEQMAKGHQKIRSESGTEINLSLPKGVALEDGDVLACEGSVMIAVQAIEEDLINISSGSKCDWAAAAYTLGNLHKPVRFSADAIRTPYTAESVAALEKAGIDYKRTTERMLGRRIRAVGAK